MSSSHSIFTARIRRMGEGNIFSLFTLAGGGTPSQVGGGYPARSEGVPRPGLDVGGVPHLR